MSNTNLCPNCGAKNKKKDRYCLKCGTELPGGGELEAMAKKYKALRTIASIYKILGIVAGIVTILAVIGICAASVMGGAAMDSLSRDFGGYGYSGPSGVLSGVVGGLLINFFVILNGGGLAITFFAMGEGIYLLISLEENTRATVGLLKSQ